MRFVSCTYQGAERVGRVDGADLHLFDPVCGDMVDVIRTGTVPATERTVALDDVVLLAPLRRFRRDILCTGWNYWDHFEEGRGRRDGQEVDRPSAPTFFTKGPDTVIGPEDDIAFDPWISARWDYEVELALVIGKAGRSIPAAEAEAHVFGYFLANDVSQRDLQRRHGGQWLKGKSIDATMPIGPQIVTPDELDLPNLRLECHLNGRRMQSAEVRQMAFAIPELIAELSFGMTLQPGDVILSGTPAGVGNARTPPVFLQDGDEVVCTGTGLGALRNRVRGRDLHGRTSVPDMRGPA